MSVETSSENVLPGAMAMNAEQKLSGESSSRIYKREPSKSMVNATTTEPRSINSSVMTQKLNGNGVFNHERTFNGCRQGGENESALQNCTGTTNNNGVDHARHEAEVDEFESSMKWSDIDALKATFIRSGNQLEHKRPPEQRVFVNRNLPMEKIQFFGFDMDYTLAVYKSPQMEKMSFGLIVERMISIGYPEEFRNFEYNPIFAIRGLWFDTTHGNLLKVDGFGNILVALHGFHFLSSSEIEEFYPNKFIHLSDQRVYVLNTLFNLPETYLVACLVDYFDHNPTYQQNSDKTGVKIGEVVMSYKSIFQDIRSAVDWVHFDSDMKKNILSNLEMYIEKDERIVQLLTQLRNSGRKTFLLTNSEYSYTNGVMKYLLGNDWTSYFDITVVDARKPLWFAEGTVFREVNTESGALKIGIHMGPLRQGAVYSGGSCDAFRRLVKARGKDVLYVGDHVFGDVLRSKKSRGWHTFLVVPELEHELRVWTGKRPLFEKLRELDSLMADIYKNLDGSARDKPKINDVLNSIRSVTYEMDQEYSVIGSLFRSGSRTTFFASQVERYADLYASSCYNLVYYPVFYFFRAPMTLMPHESTVDHSAKMRDGGEKSVGQQVRGWNKRVSKSNTTFCYEEDEDEDEEAASSSNSDFDSTQQQKKNDEKSSSGGESSSGKSSRASTATPRTAATATSAANGSARIHHSPSSTNTLVEEKRNGNGSGSYNCTDILVPKSSFVEDEHH